MAKKILLIASAPLKKVLHVAGNIDRKHINSEFTLLVKTDRAERAAALLPTWRILTYTGGALTPWNESLPHIETLRSAAAEGVYYVCGGDRNSEYFDIELLARNINREGASAILYPMGNIQVRAPREALGMLLAGNIVGAREFMENFNLRRGVGYAGRSTTTSLSPRTVLIFMEPVCNYRCVMCSLYDEKLLKNSPEVPQSYMTGNRKMELKDYYSLVDQLAEMGTEEIALCSAGEPLLDSRLPKLLQHIAEAGLSCTIATNGYAMDKRARDAIISTGVKTVSVSLNAGTKETYARLHNVSPEGYFKVVSNIRKLIEERDASGSGWPIVGISLVISRINIGELDSFIETGKELRANWLFLRPPWFWFDKPSPEFIIDEYDIKNILKKAKEYNDANENTLAPEVLVAYDMWSPNINLRKSFFSQGPCYTGWVFSQVTSFGDVMPCSASMRKLGNLFEKPFAEIWNGPDYIKIREEMLSLPESRRPVSGCDCFSSCPHVWLIRTVRNEVRCSLAE